VTSSKLTYPVGLSCSAVSPGPAGCWLLGMTRASRPLALRWQGQGWVSVAVPATHPQSYLTGLACASDCSRITVIHASILGLKTAMRSRQALVSSSDVILRARRFSDACLRVQ